MQFQKNTQVTLAWFCTSHQMSKTLQATLYTKKRRTLLFPLNQIDAMATMSLTFIMAMGFSIYAVCCPFYLYLDTD